MKLLRNWKVVLAAGAILACVGSFAHAQTVANGPYYAIPSWDQKLQCDTPSTCPRFIVLANWSGQAVLDRETGLVWQKSPSQVVLTWFEALSVCGNLTLGGPAAGAGRKGWRLPARAELLSLVDPSQSNPSLPAGHPFNVEPCCQSRAYWSATTDASLATNAWFVSFENGDFVSGVKSSRFGFVNYTAWCVRGGPGVDPQ